MRRRSACSVMRSTAPATAEPRNRSPSSAPADPGGMKGSAAVGDSAQIRETWARLASPRASFGIGELLYPGDWFADLYAKQLALDVIQKVFLGAETNEVSTAFRADSTPNSA